MARKNVRKKKKAGQRKAGAGERSLDLPEWWLPQKSPEQRESLIEGEQDESL